MNKQLLIFSFILLVTISNIQALSEEYKIQTKKQAYDAAIRVTGFEQETFVFDSLILNDIVLDTIFDDNIPFWVPEDSGTLVWVVTFDELKFDQDKINKKTYKVYLQAKTKQLIKITGQTDVKKDFFFDKYSKESLIKVNKGHGEEWVNFPEKILCTFSTAIGGAIVRPLRAKELYAVFVKQQDLNHEPRAIWIIYCYDLPYNINNRFTSPREKIYLDGSGRTLSISTF